MMRADSKRHLRTASQDGEQNRSRQAGRRAGVFARDAVQRARHARSEGTRALPVAAVLGRFEHGSCTPWSSSAPYASMAGLQGARAALTTRQQINRRRCLKRKSSIVSFALAPSLDVVKSTTSSDTFGR